MENNTSKILEDIDNSRIYKIMVIDDDPNIVDIMSVIIYEMGRYHENAFFEFHSALNGNDGLKKIDLERPDLVFLDIQMPEMNGFRVLENIRKNDIREIAGIPVVMLTARKDVDAVLRAKDLGIKGYLIKPFKKTDLMERIRKILQI